MSRKRLWDEERLQEVRDMQDIGMSKSEIARHFKMSRAALANACVRHNVETAIERLYIENMKLRQFISNAGLTYE